MTKYHVRSRELIDLVNEIKSKRLIMSPYFQRNLVWRQIHKVDFTIFFLTTLYSSIEKLFYYSILQNLLS